MFAVANGDITKIQIDAPVYHPYLKISLHGLDARDIGKYIDAFEAYMEMLADAITEKIPKILKEASELAEKAASVKDNAVGEIQALSPL
jgi:hypothetical protein